MTCSPWLNTAFFLVLLACGTPKNGDTGSFADNDAPNPNDEALDSGDQQNPSAGDQGTNPNDTAEEQSDPHQESEEEDDGNEDADSGTGVTNEGDTEDPGVPDADPGDPEEHTGDPMEDAGTPDPETPDSDLDSGTTIVRGTELPTSLPPRGTSGTLTARSETAPSGIITAVDVSISVEHTCTKDLTATLTSPAGTSVVVFDLTSRPVCSSDMDGTLLSDDATTPISDGTTPFVGAHKPTEPLSAFMGENAAGPWTLTIVDDTTGDSGRLLGWSLEIRLD